MTYGMNQVFIRFECGRRGVSEPECRYCGRDIHQLRGEWVDGHGKALNDLPGQILSADHRHEPALEEGPTLGPFEDGFVQVTYQSLRDGEGKILASYDEQRGDWIIEEPWAGAGEAYSDIVIFTKEVVT